MCVLFDGVCIGIVEFVVYLDCCFVDVLCLVGDECFVDWC